MSGTEQEGGPVAFVLLAYGLDANAYRVAYARGDVPDASPYGFHFAAVLGWRLIFSADRAEGRLSSMVRRLMRRVLGFDLIHAWTNRDRLRAADVVWTMTENEWLAVRCLALLRLAPQRPLVGNSVWLFERWRQRGPIWRALVAQLAHGPGILTVHSDRYLSVADVELPGVRFERMYFGTAVEPARSVPQVSDLTPARPRRILAMGNDHTRDWATFLLAFGNDLRFEVDLVCGWIGAEERAHYANLRPRAPTAALSRAEMGKLFNWSDLVVVPMRENLFSGITSAIDACGAGRPVVSTVTGGVPTYFNQGEVLFVPVCDATALRDAALLPAARLAEVAAAGLERFRRSDYTSRGMMARYAALSEMALGGVPGPATRP